MAIIKRLLNSLAFGSAWIIISVVMEIVPALGGLFILFRRRIWHKIFYVPPVIDPEISIIIPVYNSAGTLFRCISSIVESSYSTESIRIFLVNNGGSDDSFSIFSECQRLFPDLKMQWMNAEQGKSRAMNLALYNSEGKYIINLDSDGWLEKNALANMVAKFEANPDLDCMTGAVLTDMEDIQAHKGSRWLRLLQNLEFMEYAQAFLAGRSYASETNSIYTLSGAFSAFRKSAVLSSWLYNTDTVCEDTHITFQMRYRQKKRVEVCENAIYFTDPIKGPDELYTQRQRWQRGSLEVAQMFMDKNFQLRHVPRDINVRTLLFDHTFALPRMIWYLAMFCLMFMNYSGRTLMYAMGAIFVLYILIGFFHFFAVCVFLRTDPEVHRYYVRHWYLVFALPFFNIFVFFIRIAGIINSISTDSAWKAHTFSEERKDFFAAAKVLSKKPAELLERIRRAVNRSEGRREAKRRISYSPAWYIGTGTVWLIGALLFVVVYWSRKTFGVEINEIVNTLAGGTDGTGAGMKEEILRGLVLPMAAALSCWILFCVIDRFIGHLLEKKERKPAHSQVYRGFHTVMLCAGAGLLFLGTAYGNYEYELLDYIGLQGTRTHIYEDYYVPPAEAAITAPDGKKNLICIYVESLETTYASREEGGNQEENCIPRLTELARQNLNFSDEEGLGGFHCTQGSNWTMAALFATTSGVPYALPGTSRNFLEGEDHMPGIVTLGDVLKENGYTQKFVCGSAGAFAGRSNYFIQHGAYEICDLHSARKKGYIPMDYKKNWGIEDKVLFDIAREELTDLAAQGEPFNFTVLTVDLHAPYGYICDWCPDEYGSVTGNVAACSDRLVADFVEWCQQQDFYKDSVIAIMGDHPRMDGALVEGVSYYDRTVYTCLINSDTECRSDPGKRTYTSMDMFPTMLASLGFEIEGDRLGLGVNLFSEEKTLAEERGFDWLNNEVLKTSDYYMSNFVNSPAN